MSSDGNMNSRGGGGVDLGKTEEMPAGGPLSSRSRVNVSSKPVPAARPSEPLQLADGQSSGESQAAYAAGPKPIPASRHNVGSDPAPAVIVDGAQAHTYEPLETPPPSSTRGGLYIAPVPVPAIAAPAPERPGPPRTGRTGTVPMSRPFATPQFASPLPEARGRARSETVVITMPGRKTGPSSKEKVLAFVVMLVIVALLGIILLLWQGLGKNPASGASPEPRALAVEATAAQVVPQATVVAEPTFVAPPPVAVVAAPAALEDAGKKLPKKH